MNVWLDDLFEPSFDSGYDVHVKTAEEAIELLKTGKVRKINLDHDLGYGKTGLDVAKWILEKAKSGELKYVECFVHTGNPLRLIEISKLIIEANKVWLG
jgi:hypothetical protein